MALSILALLWTGATACSRSSPPRSNDNPPESSDSSTTGGVTGGTDANDGLAAIAPDLRLSNTGSCADTGLNPSDSSNANWKCDVFSYDPFGDVETTENEMAGGTALTDTLERAKRIVVSYPPDYDPTQTYDLILSLHGKGGDDIVGREFFLLSYTDASARFKYGTSSGTAIAMAKQEAPAFNGRVIIAALNSGSASDPEVDGVDTGVVARWSMFAKIADGNPATAEDKAEQNAEMNDARRLISFARHFKLKNPNVGKTFLFGFSSGGIMTQTMACFYAAEFDGYGIVDYRFSEDIYTECGRYGDEITSGEMHEALTLDAAGTLIPPSSLRQNPRPIFLSGGTHSTRWTFDVGDATNLNTVANNSLQRAEITQQEADDILMNGDRRSVQHNFWTEQTATLVIEDRAVNGTIPFANNPDVNVPGRPDPKTTMEKYLALLGINGNYQSVLDCAANGNGRCATAFPDQASFCRNAGDKSLFKVTSSNGLRKDVTAASFNFSSSGRKLRYIEIDGGAHYTQGRANVCAGGGSTHDVDTGTEFIKFMLAE